MAKTFKRVWNILTMAVVVAVIVLALLLVGVRVIGYTPYVVLSGSMEPVFPTGSLIYVKAADAGDVSVGDPITFDMGDGTVATHRVVAIDNAAGTFTTKGDANNTADFNPVPFDALIGMPVFCIPHLGYLSDFLTEPPGMYIGWSVIAVLLILMFLPEMLAAAEKADKRDAEKQRNH
ncbi:MAG: signal peptidase I [Oscillospiraceae bacterium]